MSKVQVKQEECPGCFNAFTQYNLPRRLINCQHLMCQRCVISLKQCKICDRQVGLNNHFLKDYVIVTEQKQSKMQQKYKKTAQKTDKCNKTCNSSLTKNKNSVDVSNKVQHTFVQPKNVDTDQFLIQQCLLHSKPADLICLEDRAIICSSCALFGKHKGHEVTNREGVLTKFANFVEDCLKIYDQLILQTRQFSVPTFKQCYRNLLNAKKQGDQKRITNKFETLISTIKVIQKRELLRVSQFYKERQKYFQSKQSQIQLVQEQSKRWLTQIQGIGSLMSDTSSLQKISDCIPYIDQNSILKQTILNKGDELLQRFKTTQKNMQMEIDNEKIIDCLQFNQQKLKGMSQYFSIKDIQKTDKQQSHKKISSQIQLPCAWQNQSSKKNKGSLKKQHLRTQADQYSSTNNNYNSTRQITAFNGNAEDLLLSIQPPMDVLTKMRQVNNICIQRVQIAQELDAQNIPYLSISDIRPITNSGQSSDRSRIFQKDRQLKQFINVQHPENSIKDDNKKKKKIEIPEKYKGIVDDLKNDRAQTIDLTGAQIGDNSIISLCPYIKKSKKLKTLKAIKNKLTDECLAQLFEALNDSKLCSLNLSQNLLSDKACSIIHNSVLPQSLKTVTLSLNKINRRNVKNKIDQLTKRGVTILL